MGGVLTARKAILVVSMSMLAWSCATVDRQADDLFAAGEYVQAARAYEAYLDADPESGPATSKALYRLAVTYGSASSSLYDPKKSVALLQELLSGDPDGEYSLAAEVMLQQQKEIVSLSAVVASRRDLIQNLIDDLSRLQEDLERTETEVGERNETVQDLSDRIERLRREIAHLSKQLSERASELEKLKEIDLDVPPI
jgi:septal ring factor EnvC (AmiA/AmiB activator)